MTLLTAPPNELMNLLYELLGLFVDTSPAIFLLSAGKSGASDVMSLSQPPRAVRLHIGKYRGVAFGSVNVSILLTR